MLTLDILTCPYIDKVEAAYHGTMYYCTYDEMEFESMEAHCKHCEMYRQIIKRALGELRHAEAH